MSWWGHTFIPVVQELFYSREWEEDPVKVAYLLRQEGHNDVANAVDRMTPEKWQEASQIAHLLDDEA